MPRGRQLRVRSPGKNQKTTVFGAWCYGRGLFLHHTQPRKTAWGWRMLLQKLVSRARRTGRKIILVMDSGNPHHAKVVRDDLQNVRAHVMAFWLPHYSPELNLIEILWRHLKRAKMANVLFSSHQQFTGYLIAALEDFAHRPDLTLKLLQPSRTIPNRKQLRRAT